MDGGQNSSAELPTPRKETKSDSTTALSNEPLERLQALEEAVCITLQNMREIANTLACALVDTSTCGLETTFTATLEEVVSLTMRQILSDEVMLSNALKGVKPKSMHASANASIECRNYLSTIPVSQSQSRALENASSTAKTCENGKTRRPICDPASKPSTPPTSTTTEVEPSSIFEDKQTWNLQLVGTHTPEYAHVQNRFVLGVGNGLALDTIYVVRNEQIAGRYCDEVAKTLEKGTFKGFQWVWHGTIADEEIVRSGFGVGGVDVKRKHGANCGVGVYGTTKVLRAIKYGPKRASSFRVLLCELCVTTDTMMRRCATYVQPNKHLIRPVYVVHCRKKKKENE